MADGGTLFLDEVGEISPKMQVALLRVLEDGSFLRVGGSGRPLTSDFRLICATHRNLPQLIEAGDFRQDFYYRINVFSLAIPPLRHRREDIIPLAEHFIAVFSRETGKAPPQLDDKARRALLSYAWPGNVRELRNIMEAGGDSDQGRRHRPGSTHLLGRRAQARLNLYVPVRHGKPSTYGGCCMPTAGTLPRRRPPWA